jgi:hypothetical protein
VLVVVAEGEEENEEKMDEDETESRNLNRRAKSQARMRPGGDSGGSVPGSSAPRVIPRRAYSPTARCGSGHPACTAPGRLSARLGAWTGTGPRRKRRAPPPMRTRRATPAKPRTHGFGVEAIRRLRWRCFPVATSPKPTTPAATGRSHPPTHVPAPPRFIHFHSTRPFRFANSIQSRCHHTPAVSPAPTASSRGLG